MTTLVWDKPGTRRFETGCDRGVLYLSDGTAVPWNGLTSVEEDNSDIQVQSYYMDGVKYLDRRTVGEFGATLKALTYPDEFAQFDGLGVDDSGFLVPNQPVGKIFGLSYRTLIGNDLNPNSGYRIHLLYNLTATPDNRAYSTVGASSAAMEFSWKLSGIPIVVPGFRPTCHLIVDSTKISVSAVSAIEALIYGTSSANPALPDAPTLATLLGNVATNIITDPISEPI